MVILARRWWRFDISIAFSNVAERKSMSWAYKTWKTIIQLEDQIRLNLEANHHWHKNLFQQM